MAKETRLVRYDRQALTTYVYDGRLNLIEKIEGLNDDIVTRYRYDALNRLVAVEPNDGGTPRRFTYDAATRRLSSDGMLHFYGPGWETLADVDGGSLHARRIYVTAGGMDSQVAMLSKSEAGAWSALYYLRDHLGSVIALVDGSGAVVESYEYAPYGAPTLFDSSGDVIPTQVSAHGNRFLYTGREWEPGLGMYHFRYRTYSPYDRRFMQSDPIGLWGGWNLYTMCYGNPIVFRDPYGLDPIVTSSTDAAAWAMIGEDIVPDDPLNEPTMTVGTILVTTFFEPIDYGVSGCTAAYEAYKGNYKKSFIITIAAATPFLSGMLVYKLADVMADLRLLDDVVEESCGFVGKLRRRFIVDRKGNTLVEPPGGATVGNPDGTFVETRFPNESPAQQLHGPHNHFPQSHGHGFEPGAGRNQRGNSLDPEGNVVPPQLPRRTLASKLGVCVL